VGDRKESKGYPEPLSITTAGREVEGSMRESEKVAVILKAEGGSESECEAEDHGREEVNKDEKEGSIGESKDDVDADFDPK